MKKIINISLCLFFLAGFSSCLKDDTIIGPDSPGAIKHIVEFMNPAPIASGNTNKVPVYVMSYEITPEAEMNIVVSYSGGDPAPNDIHVKVALDNDAIEASNAERDDNMLPMPENIYDISSLDVTIPKGQKTGTIKVTLKPELFGFSQNYALGFKIVSVTGTDASISGNFGTIVTNIGAKNQWDGDYKYTAVTSLGNATNEDAHMTTVGQYKVTMYLINYYSNQVVFTVDPATNKVEVSMTTLLPIATDPSSHWDPATKTFHVKWTSNGGARQFNETYVKQ